MKIGLRNMKDKNCEIKKLWWINWNFNWDLAEFVKNKAMCKSMFNGLLVGPSQPKSGRSIC